MFKTINRYTHYFRKYLLLLFFGIAHTAANCQQTTVVDSNVFYLECASYWLDINEGYTDLGAGMYLFNEQIPAAYIKTTTCFFFPDTLPHDGTWICQYDSANTVAALIRYKNHRRESETLIELFPSGILSSYCLTKDTNISLSTRFELLKSGYPNFIFANDQNGSRLGANWDDSGKIISIYVGDGPDKGRKILFDSDGTIKKIKKIKL